MEFVKNGEIVLNVSFDATSSLHLGNEFIEFKARFGGVAREIVVPIDHVVAIYARENGQGMAFPAPAAGDRVDLTPSDAVLAPVRSEDTERVNLRAVPSDPSTEVLSASTDEPSPRGPNKGGGRPTLKRVK
jgi:stringent starvation protein B